MRRKRLQFGLRTVLVLTALFGLFVHDRVRRATRQRASIEAVHALGGEVIYRHQYPDIRTGFRVDRNAERRSPRWVRTILGDAYAPTVTAVMPFADAACTDEDLAHLKNLPNIRKTFVQGTRISDAGMRHFRGLKKLEDLNLHTPNVTDDGIAHLSDLVRLRVLYLNNTSVTGNCLVYLSGMTNLEKLSVAGRPVKDTDLKHLSRCKRLQWLYLDSTQVSDEGLQHLQGLTALTQLSLGGTYVTDAGMRRLQRALPKVKIFR